MNPQISFFVEGVPRAKQSFRVSGRGRGFTPALVKCWQAEIGWSAQQCMHALGFIDPLTDPLTVQLTFFLKDARRIDLDNLSKAVQDGMNGIVYQDDQQNVHLVLDKYICRQRQGVFVQISRNMRSLEISGEQLTRMLDWSEKHEQKFIQQ